MQLPPLSFMDVSLLFAVGTIVLLVTAELSWSYNGLANLTVDKAKLRKAMLTTGVLFVITLTIRIITVTLGS